MSSSSSSFIEIPNIQYVILDIDGTLIDGCTPDSIVERPNLDIFIKTLFLLFQGRVGIWTAASVEWLEIVLKRHLLPKIPEPFTNFAFVLWRMHCVSKIIDKPFIGQVHTYTKPLRLLSTYIPTLDTRVTRSTELPTYENSIIVDDTPETFVENPDKAIFIDRFYAFNVDKEVRDRTLIRAISTIREVMTSPSNVTIYPLR